MSTKTRSALRATLKQEDAALEERLPEATPTPATQPETAPRASKVAPQRTTPDAAEAKAKPPAAPASTAPALAEPTAPAEPAAQAKPEKRKHERFKLAASDRRRLGALRDDLKAAGRRPSKSELVRAGLTALAAQDSSAVMALVDTLSPPARAKDKKARRKKNKKAGSKRKSASKKR